MSYFQVFLAVYPFVSLLLVVCAILALVVSDHICNTASINKHWVAVCLIISGLVGMRSMWQISLLIIAVMFIGIVINYLRLGKKKVITIQNTQHIDLFKRVK